MRVTGGCFGAGVVWESGDVALAAMLAAVGNKVGMRSSRTFLFSGKPQSRRMEKGAGMSPSGPSWVG